MINQQENKNHDWPDDISHNMNAGSHSICCDMVVVHWRLKITKVLLDYLQPVKTQSHPIHI